jgi:hypothetical protein
MSEHRPEPDAQEAAEAAPAEPSQELAPPLRTGVDEVDAVLDSVAGLDGAPVEEHVAVFEQAHERLRGALDGRADG